MDVQHHKITATNAGHEAHGVHLCHRCGWPFPKPHPSSKHRRAHKRVCGRIEGYKIIHSEDQGDLSDDDHASDDDEHRTPSMDIVKKNAESSGRAGEKSPKSEDDVFSDAVMDFSDGVISPQLEEHSKSVSELGLGKSLEQKSSDLYGSGALEVEEAADKPEQFNDARSEELIPPTNGNNNRDAIVPINTAPKIVYVESINDSRPEHEADIEVQEHGSTSVSLDSQEGNGLDQTISTGGSRDELCYEFVTKAANNDSLRVFSLEDENHESIDTSVGSKEVSHLTENTGSTDAFSENTLHEESLLSTLTVKPNESMKNIEVTEQPNLACDVWSVDKVDMPKTILDLVDASEGEKSDTPRGNENQSLEPKNLESIDTNSTLTTTDNGFPCEGDNAAMEKKDGDHCGENTNITTLETGNEKVEGASAEVEAIRDSPMPSNKPNDFPSSTATDTDAKRLQELSENNSTSSASKDGGFQQSLQGDSADSEVNEIGDAFYKSSSPAISLEHSVSPVTSELQNNVILTKSEIESVDVAETLSESEDDYVVLVSGKTPEDSISKELMTPLPDPDSVLLSKSAAKDDNTVKIVEDHETNVVSREISERSTASVQAPLTCESSNVTSADVILKSVGVITSELQTSDGKISKSDDSFETSEAPSLKQPLPLPSDVEDFGGISHAADEEPIIKVEDIITKVGAESLKTGFDYNTTKQTDGASAIDMSSSLIGRSDSLEANCGSVLSDSLETNSQKQKSLSEEEVHRDKSDTFEPPSFMTLVQSRSEGDHKVTSAAEIETVQNNQQPKSDALEAGWFPTLTNVVNESEGRKKNEEIIAKVTNWSTLKQNHSPLKSLLNEVKSPNTKQMPISNQKVEVEGKHGNVGTVVAPKTHTAQDQDTKKHVDEWNSPARYPIEIKKEKKKGRSFWIPFVCCSSVHRDL